jgi:HAD superfamily hydrolase (TIGR01509 family)
MVFASARAQDMRMPDVDAVLFDYGRTLVTFTYPRRELLAVIERFRPAIEAATGAPSPAAEAVMDAVLLPLESVIESPDETEVSWLDTYADAWRAAGIGLPDELLYEILDAEQQVWDDVAAVDPDALDVLRWLRDRDIKRAVCSNAPFPPEMMLRQVEQNGIATLMDAVVFSSQIGLRKPAPRAYRATLEKIEVDAARALFVGDRVREDYVGPVSVGMRAVICTAHAASPPPEGIPTIASLADLPGIL